MPKTQKLYYGQRPSITIQLERLQSDFDGMTQLVNAIHRVIFNWNDVWGSTTIKVSDAMTDVDWSAVSTAKPMSLTSSQLGRLSKAG